MSFDQILSVSGLRTYFYTYAGVVKAVDGIGLQVNKGETVGLVGESGSGKTVTAQSIMRVVPTPGKTVEGEIEFQGKNLLKLTESEMQHIRGKEIAYIPQDPTTTLDPVYSVGDQLAEVIMRHQPVSKKYAITKAIELLRNVGIADPQVRISQYPHELSGGTSVWEPQTSVHGSAPLVRSKLGLEEEALVRDPWKCPELNPASIRVQISSEMLLR